MNVQAKVQPSSGKTRIAHSLMAYDKATEALELELPIPLFLDTLALKIARVPPEDKYGALSYALDAHAIGAFRFLLGLNVDASSQDYFLESTTGLVCIPEKGKLEAVKLLTQLTPRPRYERTLNPNISERELVLPTLRLLDQSKAGWMTPDALMGELTNILLASAPDTTRGQQRENFSLSLEIQNMISHRDQPSNFIQQGLVRYEREGLQISDLGRSTVRALVL